MGICRVQRFTAIRGLGMMASVRLALSLIMAVSFLLSGLAKFRSGRFVADLANYRLLPTTTVVPFAKAVPFVEVGLGLLILGWTTSALPIYAGVVVLAVFTAAMIVNLARGRNIACGCRGSDKPISWGLVASNLSLATIAAAIAVYQPAIGGLSILEGIATAGYVGVACLAVRLLQQGRQLRSTARLLGFKVRQATP